MMTNPIDPAVLRELLRYEPETGKLYWLSRSLHHFKSTAKRSAEWNCAAWNAKNAGKEAFTAGGSGYRSGAIYRRNYGAHRVVWAIVHGMWPKMIDHINGDPSDNRLENLREVTSAENQKNLKLRSDNTSGRIGVSWDSARKRWSAEIISKGRHLHLGRFRSKSAAIQARKMAEQTHGFHPNHGRQA